MNSLRVISFLMLANLFLLPGVFVTYSEAQPRFSPPGDPDLQAQQKRSCRKDPSITFSEDQVRKFESLQRAYLEEVKPSLSELSDLRLELRFTVSNPQVQSQDVFEKQMKMSKIQAKIDNLRFSYLIKARSIFTREQLERFPPDCPLKMGIGYREERGMGRGPRKGYP